VTAAERERLRAWERELEAARAGRGARFSIAECESAVRSLRALLPQQPEKGGEG